MRRSRLGTGREFDLIRALTRGGAASTSQESILHGPGDDAAVFGDGWVVSTDLAVESVHFRTEWLAPDEIGRRAVAAALSDLAAMAARPSAVLVSLAGAPSDYDDGRLEAVGLGARDAAESWGAPVIGGDVSRSPGPLVVDVVVLGRTHSPILRSGAGVGDDLFVTGHLGGSAAAVSLLERGASLAPALRSRFAAPTPRLELARRLAAAARITSMIDVSDGLVGDAAHLAAASGVRIEIERDRVPVDPEAVRLQGREAALPWALGGGEDYELLFTAPVSERAAVLACSDAGGDAGVTRIGRVAEGAAVYIVGASGAVVEAGSSWDHFGSPEPPSTP